MSEDTHICAICFAYFVRPWRTHAKCCSDECGKIRKAFRDKQARSKAGGAVSDGAQNDWYERHRRADDQFIRLLWRHHGRLGA